MFWSDYASIFLLGLTGTGHCLGMCGAFSLAVTKGSVGVPQNLLRQTAYQLGKATSYFFLGAVLLMAAGWTQTWLPSFRSALGILVGTVMIAMGAAYVMELRLPARATRWWQGSAMCGVARNLQLRSSILRSLLIGWLNGLLPCGLSMMALITLVNTGSILAVATGSYVFGLATMPGLLVLGLAGRSLGAQPRRWLVRAGGVALIALGVLTLVRGVPAVHAWMHEHLMFSAPAADRPCCHEVRRGTARNEMLYSVCG